MILSVQILVCFQSSQVATTGSRCASLSHKIKSKQFVFIKKICLSKCCSEIEMPGELHLGPGQLKKLWSCSSLHHWWVQTPLHGQSGQLNCEKPQLSRIGTFMHLSNHYNYLTWSLKSSSYELLNLLQPVNIPINFLYTEFNIKPGELHMGPGLYVITILS